MDCDSEFFTCLSDNPVPLQIRLWFNFNPINILQFMFQKRMELISFFRVFHRKHIFNMIFQWDFRHMLVLYHKCDTVVLVITTNKPQITQN